jgi:hypothetical protein
MDRKFVILGPLCGHHPDMGATKGVLQGGATASKRRQPGEKANTGEFFVKNNFWKVLISKPGLWVNPAMLTPVNNGLVNRGIK